MKCPKCNAELNEQTKFCPECGINLMEVNTSEETNSIVEVNKTEKTLSGKPKTPIVKQWWFWAALSLVLICIVCIILIVGGSKNKSDNNSQSGTNEKIGEESQEENLIYYEGDDEEEKDTFDEDAVLKQLDIKQYTYKGKYNNAGILVIKNNSDYTLQIDGNFDYMDSNGKLVGTGSEDIEAVGPNAETVLVDYQKTNFSKFEYSVTVSEDQYYKSVYGDLKIDASTPSKNKAIVSATNNGESVAKFVKGYVLFLKDGSVVDYEYNYLTDSDSELKPGKTIRKEFTTTSSFDSIKVFACGRADAD